MSIVRQAFATPLMLSLLALLPVLAVLALLAARRRQRTLARFGAPPLKGLNRRWGWMRLLRRICLVGGLVLLVVALAGPQWGRDWQQSAARGRDLVAVLDLSRSMLAEDVLPNRFERGKQALEELSYAIQQRGGHRLALVTFAAQAKLVCPLTHDYDHFRAALAGLDAANLPADLRPKDPEAPSGTRIGAGLRTAVEAQDPRFHGYQEILLLSDGDDPARDEEWREGVDAARGRGIPIHAVGVGNPNAGSPIPVRGGDPLRHQNQVVLTKLEEQPLRVMAEATGGTYTPARTDTLPLGEIFRARLESGAAHDNPDDALPLYRQRYAWFLGSALLLLSLEMVLNQGGSRRAERANKGKAEETVRSATRAFLAAVSVFLVPGLLGAVSMGKVEDWVRRGNAAFAGADFAAAADFYSRAEESATDPGLVAFNKAAALYHLGRYREAELHYRYGRDEARGLRRARLLYGLGNSILQQAQDRDARQLKEAINFYELCLQQEAADGALIADARHNLELARLLWLKAKARKDGGEPNTSEENNIEQKNQNDAGLQGDPTRAMMQDERGKAGTLAGMPNDAGATPAGMEKTPPPGKGNLPTLPDTDDLAPLSAEDAADYLEQAAARIQQERQEHLHLSIPALPSNVKDW